MAQAPGRICRTCKRINCTEHAKDRRGNSSARGLGGAWKRIRLVKLRSQPICELRIACMGKIAVEVDHRIPRHVRPDLNLDVSNLQSVCLDCHRVKTEQDKTTDWNKIAMPPRKRVEF